MHVIFRGLLSTKARASTFKVLRPTTTPSSRCSDLFWPVQIRPNKNHWPFKHQPSFPPGTKKVKNRKGHMSLNADRSLQCQKVWKWSLTSVSGLSWLLYLWWPGYGIGSQMARAASSSGPWSPTMDLDGFGGFQFQSTQCLAQKWNRLLVGNMVPWLPPAKLHN